MISEPWEAKYPPGIREQAAFRRRTAVVHWHRRADGGCTVQKLDTLLGKLLRMMRWFHSGRQSIRRTGDGQVPFDLGGEGLGSVHGSARWMERSSR